MQRVFAALLTIAVLTLAGPASAQTGRAMGSVIDQSGKPIKGATIRAVNKDASPSELTSTTDNKGRFGMIGLKAGVWTFTAEAPGFEPTTGVSPIRSGTIGAPLRFVIQRTPVPIPGALPGDIAELVSAADALRAQGRYDQAIAAYQAIQAKNPKVSSLNVVLGDIYRQQAAREQDQTARQALYARAIQSYSEAVKGDAPSERVRLDLGLTQVSAGLVDEGTRTLQALVASTPESAAAKDAAVTARRAEAVGPPPSEHVNSHVHAEANGRPQALARHDHHRPVRRGGCRCGADRLALRTRVTSPSGPDRRHRRRLASGGLDSRLVPGKGATPRRWTRWPLTASYSRGRTRTRPPGFPRSRPSAQGSSHSSTACATMVGSC